MTLQFEGVGFGAGPGSGGKIGTVALVAMGSQSSTPYTVGSKWFYNGLIYTATSTTTTDGGVTPSYNTAYLFNGTYYYWDGSTLQGADESNLVHITGAETITGNKTFSGKADFQGETTVVTQAVDDNSKKAASTEFVKDAIEFGEWKKPDDWVDIRSGALANSIYLLLAHSKPVLSDGVYTIADYSKAKFDANISTTGTYDVYIDGVKIGDSVAGGTNAVIDWESLYNAGIISSGYDIASPGSSNYTTHIIRITPTDPTTSITTFHFAAVGGGQQYQGCLWVHFQLTNSISIRNLLGADGSVRNVLCQAVTAQNDKIIYSVSANSGNTGLNSAFMYAAALAHLPVLEAANNTYSGGEANTCPIGSSSNFNKLTIKNNSEKLSFQILHNYKGKLLDIENPLKLSSGLTSTTNASNATKLKSLPKISTTEKGTTLIMGRLDSIEETFIDESFNDQRTILRIEGASGHQTNLVGLTVSSSAPFNYATAPQLSVKYTNMSRAALVRLFNSMPTVSDSQEIDVTGTIGAGDLTAEDLAIATGKGWTVVR